MIDTLEFARRMTDAGMPEGVAKALAHELRDGLPAGDLATKSDLATAIAELKTELKTDIAELRSELKTDLGELKAELKTAIADSRSSTIIWVAVFVGLGQVLPTVLQFLKALHP